MKAKSSWRRGDHARVDGLACTWQHENGCKVVQGRPDGKIFVYRVIRPDGTRQEFPYLSQAKAAAERPYGV